MIARILVGESTQGLVPGLEAVGSGVDTLARAMLEYRP